MRQIFAIAWKDTLVRFSSRSELLFFIILPVVFTLVLGGALTKLGQGDSRVPVLVVDADHSQLSAELLNTLGQSTVIRTLVVERAKAESDFAKNASPVWLTVPAGFGAWLLALDSAGSLVSRQPAALDERSLPNSLNAVAAQRAIELAVGQVTRPLAAATSSVAEAQSIKPFASDAERRAYFAASLAAARAAFAAAPSRIVVTHPAAASQATFDGNVQASAGQLITWVFIPLLATSALFAHERTRGTLRRLLTTPAPKAVFLLGTITGQLILALVQMLLLVVFGALVLGLKWGQSPVGLAVILVSFGLASVALGTLLGTFVRTDSQASGASLMLGMSMALLGGCWYPLELFPPLARTASKLLPTAWAMQGLNNLLLRGQGLSGVLPEAGVLLGFAALFFALGVWRFRYE
jgi:ABC-2 type transport system permease protein